MDAAEDIKTPPRNNHRQENVSPITYNGKPFKGVKIIRGNFFAKGVAEREAREAKAIEDKRLADLYDVPVETYLKHEDEMTKTISRMKNVRK